MPYLEQGQVTTERLISKVLRKGEFLLAQRLDSMVAMGHAKALLAELDDRILSTEDPHEKEARKLIREHTLAFGNTITLKPSQFHRDTFFRDGFLVRQFADSPRLDRMLLDMMADVQDPGTGYIQTSRFAFGRAGFSFPDETTFYHPILAFQAQEENGVTLGQIDIDTAREAAFYIIDQMDFSTGFIQNEGTQRTYWADELILPPGDVVAFKQGLGAVALKAANKAGWIRDAEYAKRAQETYRKLAQEYGDRLPLSLVTGWIDISALYPEYLSLALFGEPMLDDSVVKKTVASFVTPPPQEGELPDMGLRVILDGEGRYLDEGHFVDPPRLGEFMDTPGRYQNGGSWPLWEHAAWAAAKLHGLDLDFLPPHAQKIFDGTRMVRKTQDFNFPEYLYTGRVWGESHQDSSRVRQTWNVALLDQQRRVDKALARAA